jgi:AraC-like DNA-binding protein
MDPLLVRTFGFVNKDPWHSGPGTKEQDIMFRVYLEGSVKFQSTKLNCDIEAGSISFILPDNPGILYSDQNNPSAHYYCRFNGSFAFTLVNRIINKFGGQFFKSEKVQAVALILEKMTHEFRKDLPSEMRNQEFYLFQALTLLLDNKNEPEKNEQHMKMIQYLENRINQNLNMTEMSKFFHLSLRHLNRLFRLNAQMSIGQYHELIKINLSKNLLEQTNFAINEIAQRVGYQDPLYFSKVFKRNTGFAPQAWRKKT